MQIASLMRRLAVYAAGIAFAAGAHAQWQPSKPITIIVPWSAGGSTDQVTRIAAGELEKALGQKVVIVNQPGASGSIGTKNAWEAPRDGYTWTAGAAQDLGVYKALGMLDTNLSDWHLFLHVANVAVLGVNTNAPYKSVGDLIAAMKANPGKISVATAGVTSAGHNAMEAVARAAGVTYRHVTYDGGNPAVVATVAGETEVTTQLAVEQAEMIRAKRLRPLATVSDKAIEIDGFGIIDPITKSIPIHVPTNYFGVFVPKGIPADVAQTLEKVWGSTILQSDALKKYAASRGAFFGPVTGEAAQKAAFPAVQANAWLLHAGGKTKVAPDTVGIPKP